VDGGVGRSDMVMYPLLQSASGPPTAKPRPLQERPLRRPARGRAARTRTAKACPLYREAQRILADDAPWVFTDHEIQTAALASASGLQAAPQLRSARETVSLSEAVSRPSAPPLGAGPMGRVDPSCHGAASLAGGPGGDHARLCRPPRGPPPAPAGDGADEPLHVSTSAGSVAAARRPGPVALDEAPGPGRGLQRFRQPLILRPARSPLDPRRHGPRRPLGDTAGLDPRSHEYGRLAFAPACRFAGSASC